MPLTTTGTSATVAVGFAIIIGDIASAGALVVIAGSVAIAVEGVRGACWKRKDLADTLEIKIMDAL